MAAKPKHYVVMVLCVMACLATFYLQYQGFSRYSRAVQACASNSMQDCTATHDVTITANTSSTQSVQDGEWSDYRDEVTYELLLKWNGDDHTFMTKDDAGSVFFSAEQTVQAKSINGTVMSLQSGGTTVTSQNWWPFPYLVFFASLSVVYAVAGAAFLVHLPAVYRMPLRRRRWQSISFKCNIAGMLALIYPVITAVYIYRIIAYVW